MDKIGFIGVGNMGGALAQVAAKTVGPEHLLVSSRTVTVREITVNPIQMLNESARNKRATSVHR